MDNKTLAALKASIKHWQENVEAKTPGQIRLGADNCALCAIFNQDKENCVGCPVSEKTGHSYCEGTPYEEAVCKYAIFSTDPSIKKKKEWRAAAQAELDFLISLLPEGETP